MSATDPRDWLALSLLPGLGPAAYRRLLAHHPDPGELAFELPARWLAETSAHASAGAIDRARRRLRREVDAEWKRARAAGVTLLPRDDPEFPAELAEIPDPPLLLYVKGRLAPARPRVAVVGSRAATTYGRRTAERLAAGLAERGLEIVSGGASGIDSRAHRGALAAGGTTVAVFGSGLLRPYPVENAGLFETIRDRGALVSEFPLTFPPSKSSFPRRNRIVSGLSAAVVVVEATSRSGALITARCALDQGREVLAVPGPASSSRSAGANRLIQDGARLVLDIEDVVAELPPLYRAALPARRPDPDRGENAPDWSDLTPDEAAVIALLDEIEPVHVDRLADAAPFDVARLQAALFGLQLRGTVDLEPGRYYLLRPRRDP